MTGHELQYISTTNGSFDSTLTANITVDSVVESKFLITAYNSGRVVYFGVDYGDICVRTSEKDMYWSGLDGASVSSYLTLNEEHTVYISKTEYRWNGVKIHDCTGNPSIPSTPRFRPTIKGNFYYFRATTNGVATIDLVPWEDGNGTLGVYDKVNDVFYTPASGTWTAGPLAHVFESDKASLRFEASGGTGTLEITAETGWTCTTPTAFTMSTTTGTSGTTTITVTATANTGSTKIEETITFTDEDSYTFNVKLRQKVDGAGYSYLQIGEDTIDTFYIGDLQIEALYMGEEQIYSQGPFVGLKARPLSLSFSNSNLTKEITIQSSENWTITDDSTVGGYYTLQNYTTGCDGWVPSYDGSLDGGEIGEYGLWFEWQQGVSEITFQEYLENLASYGITATGTACQNARYSVYLAPHSAGGPSWLSYSQTTGSTGKTVVTVTASTTQADRTATITVTSANYSATISVSQQLIQFVDYVYVDARDNQYVFIDTGIYPTTATTFRVKLKVIEGNGGCVVGFSPPGGGTPTTSSSDSNDYRYINNNGEHSAWFDFNSGRIQNRYVETDANGMNDITFGNYYIQDNLTGSIVGTATTQSSMATTTVPIYLSISNRERMQSLEIYDGQTLVFNGHAALVDGVYGIYDSVTETLLQPYQQQYTVLGGYF